MKNSADSGEFTILKPQGRQISLSFSGDEINEVSSILDQLQRTHGYASDTMKGLFLQILRKSLENSINPAGTLNQIPVSESAEFIELQQQYETLFEQNKALTLEVEQLNSIELDVPEAVEIEKPLPEFSLILQLDAPKIQALEQVSDYRHRHGHDKSRLPIEITAERMLFNRATLYNWGGEYPTGL